jgi:membrane protein implicated in regulation of membrane protease activity
VLAIYLAALVLGLGVVLLQFVAPGADAGGESHGFSAEPEHPEADWGPIAVFFSLRFWSFALLAFGAVATAFTWFGLASSAVTLAVATPAGLLAGAYAAFTLRYLERNTVSSGGDASDVVGKVARVLLPIEPGKRGKIRVDARGRLLDFVAESDGETLEVGAHVVVRAFAGTTARVTRQSAG